MADGRVVIETLLDDSGAKAGMTKLGGTLGKMGSSVAGLGASALKGTAVAIAGVSTAIVGLGASAINYNASMEQYATSFEVMTGSADKSAEVMDRLKKLGAATPFEFEDLAKATQTLMAFGMSADESIDSFSMLGDISQGDAEKLDTFSLSLGKMQSSGKVTLESLNMMIEGGFNPLQVISQKTGESMSDLYDRVSDGKVSLDEIKGAMVTATSAGGQFYQSMDKQSQTLNGRISTLKDNFDQFTGAVFAGATSSAGSVVDMASSWIGEMSAAFSAGGASALASTFGDVIGEALTMVANSLPDVFTLADTIITSLVDSLTSEMSSQSGNIGNIMTTIITVLGSTLNNLFFLGVSMVDSMLLGIAQNLPAIGQSFSDTISMMMETVLVFLPSIAELAGTIITSLVAGMTETMYGQTDSIGTIMAALVAGFASALDNLLFLGVAIIDNILMGISQNLPTMMQTISTTFSTMLDTMLTFLPSILQTGIDIIIQLALGLAQALPTLIPQAVDMVLTLVDTILDNIDKIIDGGIQLIVGLITGIINALPRLIEKAPEIVIKIADAITRNAPKLAVAAAQLILALAKALITSLPSLLVQIPRLVASIVSAFIALHNMFYEVGANIISGIWGGISSGWSWLVDKVADLAKSLLNAAKDVLGIHSPSREFAWIGEMSAQGMVNGFDDNDPLKQIENTMVSGVNSMQMGVESYVNGNITGSYSSLADSIVGAIASSNMTIKVDKYEMGRIVRAYA